MPEEVYIVVEHKFGGGFFMTPYVSEESARKHYEETIQIYCDITKPFYPIFENEDRTHFVYKVNNSPTFECMIQKEDLYA